MRIIDWKSMQGLTSGEAMRVYSGAYMPSTPAARAEMIMALLHPPIYCDCDPDCRVVVGEGEPLISKKLAAKLLEGIE